MDTQVAPWPHKMPSPNRSRGIHMQIMLVEDNGFFREAFRQELCRRCSSAIVKEATDAEEAMQEINSFPPPQVMFIDFRLPGENGVQLTKKIKAQIPNVRIAILTSYDLPEYREAAFHHGADRYFVKDSLSWDEVEEFIECHSA
jgi:DNA-binding NarL/FixJ family response regulator